MYGRRGARGRSWRGMTATGRVKSAPGEFKRRMNAMMKGWRFLGGLSPRQEYDRVASLGKRPGGGGGPGRQGAARNCQSFHWYASIIGRSIGEDGQFCSCIRVKHDPKANDVPANWSNINQVERQSIVGNHFMVPNNYPGGR